MEEKKKPLKVSRSFRRRRRENDLYRCPKPPNRCHSYVPNQRIPNKQWHMPPLNGKNGAQNYSRTPYKKDRRRERNLLRDLHNSVGYETILDNSRNLYRSLFCLYYKILPLLLFRLPGRVDLPKLSWVESRIWEDLNISRFLRTRKDSSPKKPLMRLRGLHQAKVSFYKERPKKAKALMSPPSSSGPAISSKSSRRK